jgi:hypothetical protein
MAWGKRGHQIVGSAAAIVVSVEPEAAFMRGIAFDMGYYANVPDFIWKRPATYETEKAEHFLDLEIFTRAFAKRPEVSKPFELPRKEFDAKFPEIEVRWGRAYWRIQEMEAKLQKITQALKDLKEEKGKARQDLQEKWINLAGPMAHYVGDLSQPMHISENYDGNLTGQKGIHHYFEEVVVDQLYPELETKVTKGAQAGWTAYKKKSKDKTVLQLLEEEAANSHKDLEPVMRLDKKGKRTGDLKDARRYEAIILRRLIDGTLVLAEIYRRNLGWKWDNERFYFFNGEPAYIKPGVE